MNTKWLVFSDPFWADEAPYCNTVRYITFEDAANYVLRIHREARGTEYPGTVDQAAADFAAVHWASECEGPPPPHGDNSVLNN